MKVRSFGPASSSGATSVIRCESRAASWHSAPVSKMILATVKPVGRSKNLRFPISQPKLKNDSETIPGIEFGATGIAKLYCQTFGESDEFQPVRQCEVKTA